MVDEDEHDDGAEGQGDAPLPPLPALVTPPIAHGALADEAARELSVVRASTYAHRTRVDEAAGVFDYDCSGFVVYALRKVAPGALEPLRVHASGRPLARDFVALFETEDGSAIAPWHAIRRVAELARGDVIAWRKPAEVESRNTGHVMIATGTPTMRAEGEWVVPIVDSTAAPHGKSDDRFSPKKSGLGRGTIVLLADAAGAPYGYRWSEWRGSHPHRTTIALGRLGAIAK